MSHLGDDPVAGFRVFFSFSGATARNVAIALHDWLPRVLQAVEPFVSPNDIPSGSFWMTELLTELQRAQFGVCIITPDSLESPWLNFEAGAMAAILNGRVCPYVLGVEEVAMSRVSSPLGGLQQRAATRNDTFRLLCDIAKDAEAMGHRVPVDLEDAFDRYWSDLEEELNKTREDIESHPTAEDGRRDVPWYMDQMLSILQTLEVRSRRGVSMPRRSKHRSSHHVETISVHPPTTKRRVVTSDGKWSRDLAMTEGPAEAASLVAEQGVLDMCSETLNETALDRYLSAVRQLESHELLKQLNSPGVPSEFNERILTLLPKHAQDDYAAAIGADPDSTAGSEQR